MKVGATSKSDWRRPRRCGYRLAWEGKDAQRGAESEERFGDEEKERGLPARRAALMQTKNEAVLGGSGSTQRGSANRMDASSSAGEASTVSSMQVCGRTAAIRASCSASAPAALAFDARFQGAPTCGEA